MKKKLTLFIIITLPFIIGWGYYSSKNSHSTEHNLVDFSFSGDMPLTIPPTLSPSSILEDGTKVFDLEAFHTSHSFSEKYLGETLGYNGISYLGPTLSVLSNDKLKINVTNHLKEITTVHWHGLYLPEISDGSMLSPIDPNGNSWDANFTIKQEAQTTFYHPHPHLLTASQVYRGLSGFFIIEDNLSKKLNIPSDYGTNDIPLAIQDKLFINNKLTYSQNQHTTMHGHSGNVTIVNGSISPYFNLSESKIRFRLLNADNAAVYKLFFNHKDIRISIIATDGGFLETPIEAPTFLLSSNKNSKRPYVSIGTGERIEIIVDFSKVPQKEDIILMSENIHHDTSSSKESTPILYLNRHKPLLTKNTSLPSHLKTISQNIEKLNQHPINRTFIMSTMNKKTNEPEKELYYLSLNPKYSMDKIDFTVRKNTTEIWKIVNSSSTMMEMPHTFHIHASQFHILSINGEPPPPHLKGLKDTINLNVGDTFKIAVYFKDDTGTFMYHCHILEHEDAGMMGNFIIG